MLKEKKYIWILSPPYYYSLETGKWVLFDSIAIIIESQSGLG